MVKYIVTIGTGIFTGACAWGITKSSSWVLEKRLDLAHSFLEDETAHSEEHVRLLYALGVLSLTSLVIVIIPGLLVQFCTPQAAGAGVSLVMAYLNGNHIPYLLHWQVMLVKIFGTISACASSLPLGPEGPMVQIGASLGSIFTYCGCCRNFVDGNAGSCGCCLFQRRRHARLAKKRIKSLKTVSVSGTKKFCEQIAMQNDAAHREIISAGAAAGLAAAFGAPIGGIMFSWEEASSFWSRKVTWRCFLCTSIAVLTLALMRGSASIGLLTFPNFSNDSVIHTQFLVNLPFLTLTAIFAGVIGAFFNALRQWFAEVRPPPESHTYRIFELLVATLMCIGVMFGLAQGLGHCIDIPKTWPDGFGMRLVCPEGKINDLYTLFFSIPEETINRIFAASHDQSTIDKDNDRFGSTFTMQSLAIHCVCYLLFMSLAAGLAIPGGLFMPCIMVGSSFGLLVGCLLRKLLPAWGIAPSMYALVGATAVLGGVFRASISLVVVVVEGTRQINYIFEVILAVVMSNWVAHYIHSEGVYESDLERNGTVSFLRSEPPKMLQAMLASHIMSQNVVGVYEVETVERVLHILKYTRHNGFPVFSREGQKDGSKKLEGLILRSQIIVLLHRKVFCDKDGDLIAEEDIDCVELEQTLEHEMQTFHQRQGLWRRHTWSNKDALRELQIEGEIMQGISDSLKHVSPLHPGGDQHPGAQLYLNFGPHMNKAPIAVRGECSAARAYSLFTALGIRHLCTIDGDNNVIGLITRKDLDHAAGTGWWRHNKLSSCAAPQQDLSQVLEEEESLGHL